MGVTNQRHKPRVGLNPREQGVQPKLILKKVSKPKKKKKRATHQGISQAPHPSVRGSRIRDSSQRATASKNRVALGLVAEVQSEVGRSRESRRLRHGRSKKTKEKKRTRQRLKSVPRHFPPRDNASRHVAALTEPQRGG